MTGINPAEHIIALIRRRRHDRLANYHEDNAARNRFFIDRWLCGARQGAIELVLAEDLCFGIRNNKPFLLHRLKEGRPDFADAHAAPGRAPFRKHGHPCVQQRARLSCATTSVKPMPLLAGQVPMMDTAFANAGTRPALPPRGRQSRPQLRRAGGVPGG